MMHIRPLASACLAALFLAAPLQAFPAHAQQPAQQPAQQDARPAQDSGLRAAIAKSNAYIGLMNRTIRASEAWGRYASWVNMKTGPTGKERYITYGIYSIYDVRSEITTARAATDAAPVSAELDATMKRFIAAYEAFAPLITQASGYYERQDYRADGMTEGKALHAKMVPAAEAFLREQKLLDAQFRPFKAGVDGQELASLEAAHGKRERWHMKNVMIHARNVLDVLPSNSAPVVDMAMFDPVLNTFATAVKEMDIYATENPGKFSSFEGRPRSLLGKLREFRDKLAKAKGDARRGAANDLQWIVNDYNTMITISDVTIRTMR